MISGNQRKREKVRNIIREKFEWKNNIYIFFLSREKNGERNRKR